MNKLILSCLFLLLCNTSIVQAVQTCRDSITASTPSDQFIVNDEEVTDTKTGLIWKKCSLNRSGSNCDMGDILGYTWEEALQEAETQKQLSGLAWRLPNVKELRSIVEEKCVGPAINLAIFPDTKSSFYWTATPYADYSDVVWGVFFGNGYSGLSFKPFGNAVRLVRSEL
jgi:hypothetical protein